MFFSDSIGIELQFFGPWHILQIIITIAVVALIIYFKDNLRSLKNEKALRYTVATIGILFEVTLQIWKVAHNDWNIAHDLPIHLCSISLIGAIVIFFTKSEKIFSIIYFWAFGAVLSVLFPDMFFGPDRFRYYQFFWSHMLFLWMYMYMIFVHGFRPTVRQFFISCAALFVLVMGFMLPINLLLDSNYLFILAPDGTPFELIYGYGAVIYMIGVIIISFFIVAIWYSPIYFYLRRKDA